MRLYINKSKSTHVLNIDRMSVEKIVVEPYEIFDADMTIVPVHQFKNVFVPFIIETLRDIEKFTLVREYALGDLIQLVPVAREFKKKMNIKKLFIATSHRFLKGLKNIFSDLDFIEISQKNTNKYGGCLNLNSILERDHSLSNEQRKKHRVDIYCEFLGIDRKNIKIDWRYVMDIERPLFVKNDKTIALQIRGSGYMKTLPFDFVKKISELIVSMGYDVLLIDQDRDKGFDGKGIINACGQMDVVDIIKNLEKCACALTMDSGVLWLAHVANCPVLTFLGPTREQERLSLHPLYPEKARSINLAKNVGCSACFETRCRCKGAINCMNRFNHDTILKEIEYNLNLILGV